MSPTAPLWQRVLHANWRGLLVGSITLVVALIVLTLLSREEAGQNQTATEARESLQQTRSDYFMEGVVSRHFDANGQLSHVLAAPRIEHFLDQHRSIMQQPHIQLTRPDGAPWEIRANRADADHPVGTIALEGSVRLSRAGQNGLAALQMETEQLQVDMQARLAETEGNVRFLSPGGEVTSTGLKADFAAEQLQLLSNVQGHYEQPNR